MANIASQTMEVDPVSRIEGHLGVKVTTDSNGIITAASAHGNLFRGFENFLLGRDANDAITFVQRICGVCPVPHGMTSTYAVDNVLGYSAGHITFAFTSGDGMGVPKKAVAIRNLVLGMEFLMSSMTHFYHLAAPSYIQGPAIPPWTPYFNDGFYGGGVASGNPLSLLAGTRAVPDVGADGFSPNMWSTIIRSYVVALRIRRLTFEAGALFAGRMPMTSVYIGGGVTFQGTEDLTPRIQMFDALAKEICIFIVQEYVPIALALSVFYPTFDNVNNSGSGYGAGIGRYLSWGGFPNPDTNGLALAGGLKTVTGVATSDFTVTGKANVATYFLASAGVGSVVANLTEDISNSRYAIAAGDAAAYTVSPSGAYPGNVSRTMPNRANGYSYMKAPRWNSLNCEVGPMARLFVNGFFVNNSYLAVTLGSYYQKYAKNATILGGTYDSLDPAMVSPDIAVACVRSGLANLKIGSTVYGSVTGGAGIVAATSATTAWPTMTHAQTVSTYQTSGGSGVGAKIVGPIAAHIINLRAGMSTMDRLRARALESLYLVQQITGIYTAPAAWSATGGTWAAGGWSDQLQGYTGSGSLDTAASTWRPKTIPLGLVPGWGGTEAPRGALMHQCTINGGKITKYQCIVPTTWNGSPTVGTPAMDKRGAIEQAMIGAPFADLPKTVGTQVVNAVGGVEVLRIAQSFDPCIACAVH